MTSLEKDLLNVLWKHKLINESFHRDLLLIERYTELVALKDVNNKAKYSCKKVRSIIADEFYISDKTIHEIIYK